MYLHTYLCMPPPPGVFLCFSAGWVGLDWVGGAGRLQMQVPYHTHIHTHRYTHPHIHTYIDRYTLWLLDAHISMEGETLQRWRMAGGLALLLPFPCGCYCTRLYTLQTHLRSGGGASGKKKKKTHSTSTLSLSLQVRGDKVGHSSSPHGSHRITHTQTQVRHYS